MVLRSAIVQREGNTMYRKFGSTMSAVSIVYSMYDGPVPAAALAAAHAEDDAHDANPQKFWADAALRAIDRNTRCARESIARIRRFRKEGNSYGVANECSQILPCHLAARREYQATRNAVLRGDLV
jgi:hypothetical protein